jgi:hypothetical protein
MLRDGYLRRLGVIGRGEEAERWRSSERGCSKSMGSEAMVGERREQVGNEP